VWKAWSLPKLTQGKSNTIQEVTQFLEKNPTSVLGRLALAVEAHSTGDDPLANSSLQMARELLWKSDDQDLRYIVPTDAEFFGKVTVPDPFTEVIPDRLWTIVTYYRTAFTGKQRLTQMGNLVRLQNQNLVLVNPVELTPDIQDKIRKLGKLTHVITHTHGHNLFIPNVKQAFPDVTVVGQSDHPNVLHKKNLVLDQSLPDSGMWLEEFQCKTMNIGFGKEVALVHKPTKSLFITDLAAKYEMKDDWYHRFYLYLQKMPLNELSSQMYFSLFVTEKDVLREQLREVFNFDWDKLIMGHGRPIFSDAKSALKKALENWGMKI